MHEAIWDTPEHVGWQILHAYEQGQGNRRKFINKESERDTTNVPIQSFRDMKVEEAEGDGDTLRI